MPSTKNILVHTFSFLVIAIAFLLPVFPRTTGFLIVLLTLVWLVDGKLILKFRLLLKQPLALLFISFYAASVLWMIPTTNLADGIGNLTLKISILLFPVIFFAPVNLVLPATRIVLRFFTLGCLLCSILLLSIAAYTFFSTGTQHFTYTDLTKPLQLHPAYISMYLVFCISVLMQPFLIKHQNYWAGNTAISLLIITFFGFMIFLLSSRQEMIALLMLLPSLFLYHAFKRKQVFTGLAIVTAFIGTLMLMLFFMPEAKMRLEKMQLQMDEPYTNDAPNSVTMRKVIWTSSGEIIRENPLGVGTGDVNDMLNLKYKQNNLLWPLNDNLNAHNQYLQTGIAFGIPGLILFLIIIIASFKTALAARHTIYLIFLLLFLFCIITESMLEAEAGVVFFSFFNSLLAKEAVMSLNNETMRRTSSP